MRRRVRVTVVLVDGRAVMPQAIGIGHFVEERFHICVVLEPFSSSLGLGLAVPVGICLREQYSGILCVGGSLGRKVGGIGTG